MHLWAFSLHIAWAMLLKSVVRQPETETRISYSSTIIQREKKIATNTAAKGRIHFLETYQQRKDIPSLF
jgi:hypothetical protein